MAALFMSKTIHVLTLTAIALNDAVSFIVFSFLDLVDFFLCFLYKLVDFFMEAQCKPCYCSSSKEGITGNGNILVSEKGAEAKIVCLTSTKVKLEEISDTLYSRPSIVSEVSTLTLNMLKKIKGDSTRLQCFEKVKRSSSTFTVSSTVFEFLQSRMRSGEKLHPTRWSDCDCSFCTGWTHSSLKETTLFVKTQAPYKEKKGGEDVLFIHGFVSSSAFWTETLFPNLTKSSYRLLAFDLLGFGRSPKPDCLYTLREHLDMIEKSVIDLYKVKSFHIVAHSMGCILALALAVKYPGSIKSITLLAPPYYGAEASENVMRKLAPRRVWPPMAFWASVGCWYEHITRSFYLLVSKNHRLWEFLTKLLTRNRIRTFLIEGFFCHTHNAAWHTLHNIIFGSATKFDGYLDTIHLNLNCPINIFHGKNDKVIPIECSYNVQTKIPRARVKVVENKDHITIVVGEPHIFARQLEEIWRRSG